MSIEISQANPLMEQALNYRSMRQDMIASNIANADTPFYKPRDINFAQTLIAKKNEISGKPSNTLAMAQTEGVSLQGNGDTQSSMTPQLFFRDGHMARNDGNSVDIDVETTEMSKNSIMFNALVAAIKKDNAMYTDVIDASSKVS